MKVLVNCRYPLSQLQLELNKTGIRHSQSAISQEFLKPLIFLGIVGESQGEYQLTLFGSRLANVLGYKQGLPKE